MLSFEQLFIFVIVVNVVNVVRAHWIPSIKAFCPWSWQLKTILIINNQYCFSCWLCCLTISGTHKHIFNTYKTINFAWDFNFGPECQLVFAVEWASKTKVWREQEWRIDKVRVSYVLTPIVCYSRSIVFICWRFVRSRSSHSLFANRREQKSSVVHISSSVVGRKTIDADTYQYTATASNRTLWDFGTTSNGKTYRVFSCSMWFDLSDLHISSRPPSI